MRLIKRYVIVVMHMDLSGIDKMFGPYDDENSAREAVDTVAAFMGLDWDRMSIATVWGTE